MASRKPTRAARPRANDALSLLKDDHARLRQLFARFARLQDPDEAEKDSLVEQACAALIVHMTLEEELFYPALRGSIRDGKLLDEAQVEHATAKQLIAQLHDTTLERPMRDATFTVLGEYISHHIGEEEGQIFRQIRRNALDLASLGEEMLARKLDLQAELVTTVTPAARGRGERARAAAH